MRISDWSSGVCSSDLDAAVTNAGEVEGAVTTRAGNGSASTFDQTVVYDGKGVLLSNTTKPTNGPTGGDASVVLVETGSTGASVLASAPNNATVEKLGRASCRERVCQYV